MDELHRALADIRTMRSRIAEATPFRGYGPLAFGASGVFAVAAAVAQSRWIADPFDAPAAYLGLWIATALLSSGLIGYDVVARSRRIHSGLADAMIQGAAERLVPSLVAGALLTAIVFFKVPELLWTLPGLWQVILALGAFASSRDLPRAFTMLGIWYLFTGLSCLVLASGDHALSPWAMGLPFGVGQFVGAFLIAWTGEGDAEA
ncbi:MAG: hypothetical protein AB7S41_03515 [Parvibaculaceae bacterium]